MPLDIRSQVVTALDNINRNPELYTPPKPTIPLETRINDLKEANPSKYRDYISTLTSSANSGNEEARELLGKVGEDAARQRRGYDGKKIVNKNIDRSYSKLTSEEKRDVLDHELHHTIDLVFRGPKRQYSPMGKFLDFSKLDKGPNPNYFGEHIFVNGSSWNEVAPRVTQIKNFLGITDGKTLMTPESLRQGFEKYIESGRFDNDISTLYNAVTNWEEFAKWVNASVPSIGAYVLVRGSDGKIHGEKVEKHNIY